MQTVGNRRDDDADEDAGDEGGLVELVSIGPHAPTALLTSVVVNGTTAFWLSWP